MDRTELRAAINALAERQDRENRMNAEKILAIQMKRDNIVRNADDDLKTAKTMERLRHKEACNAIERERQQLFADYKMANQQG